MSNTLFKKVTASAAALSIVLSVVAPVVGVRAADASVDAANRLASLGVIVDNSQDPSKYNLGSNITRREMLKVMMNLSSVEVTETCEGKFSDLPASDWGCKYAEAALKAGFIAANAKFRPNDMVTEAEALKMVMQARGVAAAEGVQPWGEAYRQAAVTAGVLSAETTVSATSAAKRSMVIVSADSAVSATTGTSSEEDDTEVDLGDLLGDLFGEDGEDLGTNSGSTSTGSTSTGSTSTETNTTVKAGELEVTLNPASVATTVPKSGVVPFGKFDITAGSSDVTINAISLKREGLSNRSDISKVYFELNNVRVTARQGLSTDDTTTVSFPKTLVVKAGNTVTLDLIAEMRLDGQAAVGAEHAFAITAIDSSAANLSGNLPLVGPMMRIGSYVVTTVTATMVSGVDNTTAKVSDKNVLLWEVKLDNALSEKSVKVKSMTVRNSGTADVATSLTNLALYNNSKKVSTDVVISGKDITFTIDSDIEDGKSENYQIRADVASAERTFETYSFEIRNTTDILVTEIVTGFSSPITLTDTDVLTAGTQFELGEVKVEWGDLLLSRDSSVATTQTVAPSTSDVVLFSANLNVTEAVTLEDLTVSSPFDDTKVNNLRLVIGGTTVATITPSANIANQTFEFTTTVKSNTKVQILANLKSTAVDNMNIGTINNASFGLVEYVSNGEDAAIIGSVAASIVSIGTPSVLVTRNDSKVDNDKVIAGAKDVEVYAFSLRANDVSDLKVTSLKFEDTVGVINTSYITNVRLYKWADLLATKNNFDFNTLDLTIPKNTSVSFKVLVDFSSSVTARSTFKLNLTAGQTVRSIVDNAQRTINVVSSAGARLVFAANGTTVITVASSTPVASIITPLQSKEVFKFDVEAKDDTLKVTDVYLKTTAAMNSYVKSSKLTVGDKTYSGDFVDTDILYFSIGDADAVKIAPDTLKTFSVALEFHDFTAARNIDVQLGLAQNADFVARVWTDNGLRVVSDSNGDFVNNTTSTIDSKSHLLARSKVTVASAAFTPSANDIYKFTVTADSNRKVTLDDIAFKLAGSADLSGARLTVYRDSETASNIVFEGAVSTQTNVSSTTTANVSTNMAIVNPLINTAKTTLLADTGASVQSKADVTALVAANGSNSAIVNPLITTAKTTLLADTGASVQSKADVAALVAAIDNVAQVSTVTPANVEVGDTFTATIGGTMVSYVATAATVQNVVEWLKAAVEANATTNALVTATEDNAVLTLTAKTAGTAFTITSSTTDKAGAMVKGIASKEISAGTTVNFIVKITGASAAADTTREANITELKFIDDTTGATAISTSTYNVGVPTTVSSYKY